MNFKMDKKGLIVSISIFLMSFFTEKFWFDKSVLRADNIKYFIAKILLLIVLLLLGQLACYIIKRCLSKDKNMLFAMAIFGGYFIIMMMALYVTWPGVWRWDEFHILDGSKYLLLNSYQHYFTSYFYIIVLMILPFPTGVVIAQVLLNSLILSYIIKNIDKYYISNRKKSILMIVPFILLPVIDSNLYPIRSSICSFIELLFIFNILFEKKRLSENIGNQCSNEFYIGYIVLSIILAVWRSENIYYLLLAPLLFIIVFRKNISVRKNIILVISIILLSWIGISYQDNLLSKTIGDQNTVITTLDYIENVVKNEKVASAEKEVLEDVDKVVDLAILKEFGSQVVWNDVGLIRDNYTYNEFKKYMKAYMELVIKHPITFAKCQIPKYINANGMTLGTPFIFSTEQLYDEGVELYDKEVVQNMFFKQKFTRPTSIDLRKEVITLIELLDSKYIILKSLLYNSLIPTILLIICAIYQILNKKYLLAAMGILVLIKVPIIFATAPGGLFMYYYPIYLIGYSLFLFYVLINQNIKEIA
ncbi:hypothetical protein UT300005_15300 [Clostridium sp. CTA-5]